MGNVRVMLELADWATWLAIAFAALLGLAGVVLLAHARALAREPQAGPIGPYAPGPVSTAARWGATLLAGAVLLWVALLHAPAVWIGIGAAAVALFAGSEIAARVGAARRHRSGPGRDGALSDP